MVVVATSHVVSRGSVVAIVCRVMVVTSILVKRDSAERRMLMFCDYFGLMLKSVLGACMNHSRERKRKHHAEHESELPEAIEDERVH